MISAENIIFNRVAAAFAAQYPDSLCQNEPLGTPATFPCLSFLEVDNAVYTPSQDFSLHEHHATVTYEADVLSRGVDGAKAQCQDIMALVDEQMGQLGFTRLSCKQAKQEDETYRMTARFDAVISEDYRIYRR